MNRFLKQALHSRLNATAGSAVILFCISLFGTLLNATPCVAQDQGDMRPNFVFIIADDISTDDLGCYGNEFVETPNLDRLASEGRVFDRAYLTISSCSPSRCSIITGRYPHNTGAPELHTNLPAEQFRFPAALTKAGYYTARSGKHHGERSNEAFTLTSPGKAPGGMGDWVQILKDRPKDQPFFFWFAAHDAHRSWQTSPEVRTYLPEDVEVPPYLVDEPMTRADLASYYHEVSRVDWILGALTRELESQGIAESTYVVYMADNGRPFPRCKTYLFDSGIRTPLVIWAPTRILPGRTGALVSSIDLAPTFLELADVEVDARVQGVSLTPILDDSQATVRDYVFAEHNWHVYQNHERLVCDQRWAYIRNAWPERRVLCSESDPTFPSGEALWQAYENDTLKAHQRQVVTVVQPAEQLYDLAADPHQLHNLALDERYAEDLHRLRQVLDQWAAETGDTVPENPTPDRYLSVYPTQGNERRNPDFRRGEFPGASRHATEINQAGPIRRQNVGREP